MEVDVVPAHDVVVSECPGDEIPCGGNVIRHDPARINWTIASSIGWHGIGGQTSPTTGGLNSSRVSNGRRARAT
ncbi:hypothetical protein [Micromonospora sp. NPDC023737]|uniref:hypothetical protein n=1 Tax=Micromonospora sp. NPDC023737 TaxID=3155014 RepID=UPI0033FAB3F2